MNMLSVAECAAKWGVSERTVRNYCATGKLPGAELYGKTWRIPADSEKPVRPSRQSTPPDTLPERLLAERRMQLRGGIYHRLQIDMTYNSNHIEGSRLTHDQTRYIYETNTIGVEGESVNVDDVVETANHFRCIDLVIDNASRPLTEHFIKELHRTLKNGTSDSRASWFAVGDYKRVPNEVSGRETTPPKDVAAAIRALLREYNAAPEKSLTSYWNFTSASSASTPFRTAMGASGGSFCLGSVCAAVLFRSSSMTATRDFITVVSVSGTASPATCATPAC